ncbi:MAG: hypothetical protein QM221_08860 [Bacillota bacterium]|nr:hypothetical protein [Bacillota bacterium]
MNYTVIVVVSLFVVLTSIQYTLLQILSEVREIRKLTQRNSS